jgi:putative FmdB family regulatory protein
LTQSNPAPRIRMDLGFLKNVPETMPLYEYECEKCGHRFEKIQKFSDKMVKKCPECGGKVEQMISAPAVQFKGSGWYVTDYANKSHAPSSDGGGKDAKKEEKSKSEGSSRDSSKENSSKGSSSDSSSKESSGKENSTKESTNRVSSSRKPDKHG